MNPAVTDLAGQLGQWAQRINERQGLLDAELNRLKTFRNDYDALEKTLRTLPDETSRSAMIPFGKLAFMPGKLIHTNEITVYLGDQYYAERSAKQALGVLDRRRQVVEENVRLLEAQRNGLQAKSEAGQGALPSDDLGVNEEGLPIVEIREEELPKEKAESAVKEDLKEQKKDSKGKGRANVEPVNPKSEVWSEKEQKDVMDMLQRLEAEEEEEEEELRGQQQSESTQDNGKKHRDGDDDDEDDVDDDDDWDDRYDTEITDNLFSSYDDDEDYATQGIIEQVDASVYDDEDEGQDNAQQEEPPNVMEATKEDEPTVEPSPLQDSVAEKKDTSTDPPTDGIVENNAAVSADATSPPPSAKAKKPSRFKVARQKERTAETIARNIAASRQSDVEKDQVTKEIPVVQETSENESKHPTGSTVTEQQEHQGIPAVQESSPIQSKSVPAEEKLKEKKKQSRFKLAREQERNVTASKSAVTESSPSSSDQNSAPPVVKEQKPSRFKLTRQQGRTRAPDAGYDAGVVVKSIPAVQDTRKRKEDPKEEKSTDDAKPKRKVTWDAVATVQEHDRSAAPSTVSSDLSSPSYTAPIKEEHKVDRTVPLQQRTINSPADIFSALKDQRQVLLDDGYPALETGEDDIGPTNLDIGLLSKDADFKTQELWQLRDEPSNPLIMPITPSEVQTIPQARKTKLDSNVMRGAVMERDIEDVDPDQVEQDMDLREVTSKYHSQRNSIVAAMGGYTFEPKEVYEVYDEDLPTNESSATKKVKEEVEVKPKKVSRFKAARMAALEKNTQ